MVPGMNRFENKVVLITGAASGIGRAAAERVASEGGRVFCVDVNADPLQEVVARVGELGGAGAAHACDVSQVEECRTTVAACVERFGRLDALVNMAGIIRMGHTESFSVETWHQVLNVNLQLYCVCLYPLRSQNLTSRFHREQQLRH